MRVPVRAKRERKRKLGVDRCYGDGLLVGVASLEFSVRIRTRDWLILAV